MFNKSQKLTGLERLLKTIALQEPDVVAHFEDVIDKKVRDAILPDASYEDFVDYMDLDGICFWDAEWAWKYEALDASKGIYRDQWGGIVRFTQEVGAVPVTPPIQSEEDLDSYTPPNPDLDWRYEWLKQSVKRFKGHRAVIVDITDPFSVARDFLLGFMAYFEAMINNPSLVDRVNEIAVDYQLRYLKNCLDSGADIVFSSGDWAMASGPMMSPKLIKKFVAPLFQTLCEYAHTRGVPCLKHSDGNIWPIFDIIIDTGADGIHPIDPTAGMDIGEVKSKFGGKICLMGNVRCATTLVTGNIEEVRKETKEVIKKAGNGGGLICMSSNSIHASVKPENYVAMVEAIREYGQYPISLD